MQGISGIIGGLGLVGDPSGRSMQIPLHWLQGSPFDNYLIPGLVLLFVLGVVPLTVLYGLLQRYSWARLAALGVGGALVVWIGVQILIIGYHARPPLQLIYGALGIVIAVLAWRSSSETGSSSRSFGGVLS
ncbi:hypothetical protein BSZ35_06630 [Salinibacter sp. 10B]|nr:hypothetical protein BSZ35_06630 [Salinibacter sp. 10B]